MKVRTKRLLSLACLMIIAGAIVFGIAFMRAGFDIGILDDTEYIAHTLDLENDIFAESKQIDSVNLEIDSFSVNIVHGDEFKIDYHMSVHSRIDYSYANNVLSFTHKEDWKAQLRGFSGINISRAVITLVVPQGIELSVACPSAKVSMDSLTLGEVNIKANSGKVNAKNLNATTFNFAGQSAKLEIDGANIENVTVSGSSSGFTLKNVTIANDLSIAGSSSKTSLESVTAANATLQGNSSRFILTNVVLSGNISVSGSSSRTRMYSCSANDYVGNGSSTNIKLENCEFSSVKYSGSSARFEVIDRIVCDHFEFSGNSSNFRIRISGGQDDFASISMTGSSSTFRIDDKKCGSSHHQSGSGFKTFSVKGSSTTCKIWFVA